MLDDGTNKTTIMMGDLAQKSESELIEIVRSGDDASSVDAFTQLVYRHQARVRGYLAGRISWRQDVADDLAQESFIAAYNCIDRFDGTSAFSTWLIGIARNIALDHARKHARRTARETSFFSHISHLWEERAQHQSVWDEASDDDIGALRRCLQNLPQKSRELVHDYYFNSRSAVAIAADKGKKATSVRVGLMRVRKALKECIEGYYSTDVPREDAAQ